MKTKEGCTCQPLPHQKKDWCAYNANGEFIGMVSMEEAGITYDDFISPACMWPDDKEQPK